MSNLPSGTLTLLFTDIEGSTELLQRLGDARYAEVLAEYGRLLRVAFTNAGGREAGTSGDAVLGVFYRAKDALAAAISAQRTITAHRWGEGVGLRVRMGLHTGEPVEAAGEYAGLDVHRTVRICGAGHGGQILLSVATAALVKEALPPGVSLCDLGLHRLESFQEPERVFQVLHPDLLAGFPPLKSLRVPTHNLPRHLTSFVGRERDIAEVKRLLSTARLVTLTGAGGCGKTRLALQVAGDLVEAYIDGVWLVELAALTDPALVPQSVASVVGVREEPGRPQLETLLNALRAKAMLVILDNCEHLIAACAHVTETLLRACPAMRILATSQEGLRIPGETIWRVPSLRVPAPQHLPDVETLAQYEAVRLFVERAAARLSTFALTSKNINAVAEVCRRLDGIPLAIELAAARVPVLPVEQIAARLDDRFRLLTQGSRTVLPRYQTLKAAMDWSYNLLAEQEQAALRRSSVFAGGWTLEASEAVCAGEGIAAQDILDVLAHLVLKSLVLTDENDGVLRYRLLETVRQYGRDRLRESGEELGVRRGHLDWFMRLAVQAEPKLIGVEQTEWLNRLDIEHGNLRAALEWSREGEGVEAGLRLAGAIWRYWYIRGYSREGRGWLGALLKMADGVPTAVRAKALGAAGALAVAAQSDYTSGRALLEEGLKITREEGDRKATAALLHLLAFAAHEQGDDVAAHALHEESLTIRREIGDTPGVAMSLHNLGRISYHHEDYTQARALFEESAKMWKEFGDDQNNAMALTNLGLVAARQADYARARSLMEEGLATRQRLGDRHGIAFSLEAFAELATAQGQPVRIARLLGAAEALREALGAPLPPSNRANYERKVAAARSWLSGDAFAAAWAQGRAMRLEAVVSEAMRADGPDPEHVTSPLQGTSLSP